MEKVRITTGGEGGAVKVYVERVKIARRRRWSCQDMVGR
jgi:hypothetical protein